MSEKSTTTGSAGERGRDDDRRGLVLAGLAALLHVMIFVLESVAWTGPRARAVFGSTLVLTGTGSMLAAALVLLLSSRAHRQAAIRQGALPLLAVLAVVVGLTT